MMKKYDVKVGLGKAVKYFVLFALPFLVDQFVVNMPDIANLTIGAALVYLVNLAKVKYGVKML